ncbi:helix-turn-helix transcriptional regulator [Dehalobacter sp. TBBPA1]|uniref:helix-turn-helix transcriptional regulator n=1 Tax=Dehalobacter sp. TBBPA1 TaxID=3235037 RepID=UPI0034A1CDBE
MQILFAETDEEHPLTINEIISKLADYNIEVERKTIYADIEALRQFGLDIKMEKTKTYDYFLASRTFELPELKLLVDAVQSSKFITVKKSNELIKKLESLTSKYEAIQLQRQVYISNRVKAMNESIYYNVDTIHQAITAGKKIYFQYYDYTVEKEKRFRKNGEYYQVSPVTLTWDDENYYLITYSAKYQGLTHYRVDKMNDIRLSEETRDIITHNEFDIAGYAKKVFGMYNGEEDNVTIQFDNSLAGVVIDRFGKDVSIRKLDEKDFTVTLKVAVSPVFIGWLFQFGDMAKVLSPESLICDLKQRAHMLLQQYE